MTAPRRPAMTRAEAAALLGVPIGADRTTAQRAYLRLARSVHPDAAPDATDAGARFDALSRARAVFEADPPPRPQPVSQLPAPPSSGWMQQPSASVGNALLVLVLLVFLLVALVTLDVAVRTGGFEQGAPAPVGVTSTA